MHPIRGVKCADCVTSSGDSYRTGNKRYSGYVVHGVQQFQFRWLSATVTFDVSADPDLAAVENSKPYKHGGSSLPAEVIQNGISVEKQAPSQLMTICLTSNDPKFDEIYLSNFATINVLDLLRRIPGVGRVSNIGSRYYAMQIWAMPDKLANFGLTVQDLQNALKDQNRESAAGVLGQQPVQGLDITIPITTQGRLSSAKQFEDIVVRAKCQWVYYSSSRCGQSVT